MPSKTRKLEQTGKLIQILVKNKALLYKCLTKGAVDGGQCRRILMGKISAAIEDERFQTWPQIEAWARKNYHRQLRKSRGNQIQKSGCNPRVSFEDLVPVVRTSEIATNVQRLLDSVIDAVGTQDLQETCRHVLTGSGLPDDLKSFIFTQEFFGIWETHIRKATSDSDAENIDNMEGEQARQREQGECDISAGRSNADQVQVQSQIHSQAQSLAARTARIAEKEPERVPRPSPAPIVRLFADMNVASVIPDPDPGAEVISSTGGHLSDISGQIDRSSVDHESNTSATSTPKRKRRPKKKTAAAQGQEDQHTPKPSTQADAYGNARPKETPIPVPIPFPIPRTVSAPTPTLIPNVLSPVRRAPAPLAERAQRQSFSRPTGPPAPRNLLHRAPSAKKTTRVAKRKPRRGELHPELFYWPPSERTAWANSAWQQQRRSPSRQESLPPAKDIRWLATPPNRRPLARHMGGMPRMMGAQTGARWPTQAWGGKRAHHHGQNHGYPAPRRTTANTSSWHRRPAQRPIYPAARFQRAPTTPLLPPRIPSFTPGLVRAY